MNVGFIGLGHMGNPMAHNLIKAGHTVYAYDVVPALLQKLVEASAKPMATLAEIGKHTDVVFTSVQTSEQVRDICLQENGLFANLTAGKLFIDCSSIDIHACQQLHRIAAARGIAMLDAPVSGGVLGAEAGTLSIMVGGEDETFKRALPLLEVLGKKVIHAGKAGMGQAAKICNNLLLAISMIGVSEAFTLAEKLGLDAKKFFEISKNSSGQCWSMTSYCPVPGMIDNVPSNRNYEPGFMAKMMLKDLHLAEQASESVDALTPLGTVATELYETFVKLGQGEKDFSAIITLLQGGK